MTAVRGIILSAALLLTLSHESVAQEPTPAPTSRKPIVFRIDRTEGRLVLTIKPNPAPGQGDLWALTELCRSHGADYPVLVLLDSKASIADLNQSLILSKVGFTNVREFVAYRDTGYMAEISFGQGIPLSHDPPWPSNH